MLMGVNTFPLGPVSVTLNSALLVAPVMEYSTDCATSNTTSKRLSHPASPKEVAVCEHVNWLELSEELCPPCATPDWGKQLRKTFPLKGPKSGAEAP